MAPVVNELSMDPFFQIKVCVTGQHRKMLDQVLEFFEITPDFDLDIMKANQDLYDITSGVLLGLREIFKSFKPDMVLVHGDTTTCFAGSLSAFYAQIAVGHIEAGLRTGDLLAPYPEEANRSLTSRLTHIHFAPTELSRNNLLEENIPANTIFVTGNTVVDALLVAKTKVDQHQDWSFDCYGTASSIVEENKPFVLITGHRRENFGGGFANICGAILELANQYSNLHFIYPLHLNPNVQKPVQQLLNQQSNIHLISPLDYPPFVYLMSRCLFIMTDSGGIQEEAPSLNKSVLVMRETTERPEAMQAGTILLVGTDKDKIIIEAGKLIKQNKTISEDPKVTNPYGDGKASVRIKNILKKWYTGETEN